jgi:hypothetical protein
LQMTPLEESDNKSHDYIGAINYRLSLFNTLIGHEKRSKAGTNRSYSLPLCHHNFKAFDFPWYYGFDVYDTEEEPQDTMASPFALMSRGTGQEYVIVDPDLASVDVHNNILERVQCLHKSTQKKRETASTSTASKIQPCQVLLYSYKYSIKEADDLERKWEEYFGDNAPFGPNAVPPHENDIRMVIDGVSVDTYDAMDDDRIILQEKRVVVYRLIRDQDGNICNEYIVWGDSGYEKRHPSKRFELRTILRIPNQILSEVVSTNGDKVYAVLDGDPYNLQGDPDRTVYQFSLSPNIEDGQQYYVQPECSVQVGGLVTAIHSIGKNHVLVGMDFVGTIELWDYSDKSAPNRIKRLQTPNAFDVNSMDDIRNCITSFLRGQGKLQNFFFTTQENGNKAVITMWQTPFRNRVLEEADFEVMVRIKYEGFINFACNGHSLVVFTHDKFGSLYLDVYHLPGSRYVLNEFGHTSLPKGVEFDFENIYDRKGIESPDEAASRHLKFANRINIRHRVGRDQTGIADHFAMDMNDRLIVIEAHDGVVGNNGERKPDGPGLIVIDLDEHASGIP